MSQDFEPALSQWVDRPMLLQAMAAIKEFHYDKGISPRCEMRMELLDMELLDTELTRRLYEWCERGSILAKELEYELNAPDCDQRILRAHLMIEELVDDVLRPMMSGDVEKMLDGLADLTYVVLGTAVQFGLPLDLAFDEVHASNMTKKPRTGARLRDKGDTYIPPNIKSCLVGTPYYESIIDPTRETSFDFHEWAAQTYPDIVSKWGNDFRCVTVGRVNGDKYELVYDVEFPLGVTTTYADTFGGSCQKPNQVIAAEILEAWNNHRRSTSCG